jgi:hypothetical protein
MSKGELVLPLREYPVREVPAVYSMSNGELIEPELYRVIPGLEGETGEVFSADGGALE